MIKPKSGPAYRAMTVGGATMSTGIRSLARGPAAASGRVQRPRPYRTGCLGRGLREQMTRRDEFRRLNADGHKGLRVPRYIPTRIRTLESAYRAGAERAGFPREFG